VTADVKAAARRLANHLPYLIARIQRDSRPADERDADLTAELEAFALACAGQTVVVASAGSPRRAAPTGSDVLARFDASMNEAGPNADGESWWGHDRTLEDARRILVDHFAKPQADLTAAELDQLIAVMLDNAWQNDDLRSALAKLIEARGQR
jgi:hypothetical protein